jgi:hypothetical protein
MYGFVASVYTNRETAGGEIDVSSDAQHALSSLTQPVLNQRKLVPAQGFSLG